MVLTMLDKITRTNKNLSFGRLIFMTYAGNAPENIRRKKIQPSHCKSQARRQRIKECSEHHGLFVDFIGSKNNKDIRIFEILKPDYDNSQAVKINCIVTPQGKNENEKK